MEYQNAYVQPVAKVNKPNLRVSLMVIVGLSVRLRYNTNLSLHLIPFTLLPLYVLQETETEPELA